MARALDAAFPAITLALAAVMFFDSLGKLPDLGTTTTAPAEITAAPQVVLPVAATATAALFAAVGLVFHHIHNATAAAGRGDRRVSDLVISMLCVSAGTLQYVFFVQPAGVLVINLGGALVLAAAAVTFFIGIATVLAHVRAGGGAAAGDAPVVRILSTAAQGAAAALVVGISIAALNTAGTG
jgi:hypothetical protein